jgi:hypothetical protein
MEKLRVVSTSSTLFYNFGAETQIKFRCGGERKDTSVSCGSGEDFLFVSFHHFLLHSSIFDCQSTSSWPRFLHCSSLAKTYTTLRKGWRQTYDSRCRFRSHKQTAWSPRQLLVKTHDPSRSRDHVECGGRCPCRSPGLRFVVLITGNEVTRTNSCGRWCGVSISRSRYFAGSYTGHSLVHYLLRRLGPHGHMMVAWCGRSVFVISWIASSHTQLLYGPESSLV